MHGRYMSFKKYILFILFISFSCKNLIDEKTSKKYNVVWIVYEDQSPEFFPQYSDVPIKLPAIQSLADEGVVFYNMHSPSAVCAPSRSAIITGMYPTTLGTHNMRTYNAYRNGVNEPSIGIPSYSPDFPDYIRPFTEYLRNAGYYCTNNNKEDYNFKISNEAWDESSYKAHWKNNVDKKPFFAIFNDGQMHESSIWLQTENDILLDKSKIKIPPYFPDTEKVRHDLAVNYSNLVRADKKTAKIIQEIKDAGEYDNTYIFFYSDHGGPFPRYKRAIYDTGTKVPFIIKPPKGIKLKADPNQLLSFIDLAPTILSIAGVDIPSHIQGKAFIGQQKKYSHKFIYTATDRFDAQIDRIRAVSNGHYKYIRNYDTLKPHALDVSYRLQIPMMQELLQLYDAGKLNEAQSKWLNSPKPDEEFYDLINDPYEIVNIINSKDQIECIVKFRKALDEWVINTNDLGEMPEMDIIPASYLK